MTLLEFKKHIEQFPEHTLFEYGISEPFSWRGSYDEVCFSLYEGTTTKEEILKKINLAYGGEFYGYKGGTYYYYNNTPVNFEEGKSAYTDEKYVINFLEMVTKVPQYADIQEKLVKTIFK